MEVVLLGVHVLSDVDRLVRADFDLSDLRVEVSVACAVERERRTWRLSMTDWTASPLDPGVAVRASTRKCWLRLMMNLTTPTYA